MGVYFGKSPKSSHEISIHISPFKDKVELFIFFFNSKKLYSIKFFPLHICNMKDLNLYFQIYNETKHYNRVKKFIMISIIY